MYLFNSIILLAVSSFHVKAVITVHPNYKTQTHLALVVSRYAGGFGLCEQVLRCLSLRFQSLGNQSTNDIAKIQHVFPEAVSLLVGRQS